MDDGEEVECGSLFRIEFFDMPEGCTADRISAVNSHQRLSGDYFEDKPFFDCYLG
jgi:hypothetical protein